MADRRHLLTHPPKSKSDQTLLSLIAAAKMSEQERRLRDEIARGGQSLNMRFHDPLAGVTNQDPIEMATGIPTGGTQDFVQGGATGLMGASEYMTPAYLRPGYQGPQTGLGPVGDALAGLGQVFQGGSAAGPMGGPSTLLAQYAGRLPDAGSAMGTMGGTKIPRGLGSGLDKLMAEEAGAARPTVARSVEQVDPWRRPNPELDRREVASLRMQIEPLETQLKAALQAKSAAKAEPIREKLKAIHARITKINPGATALSESDAQAVIDRFPVEE